MNKKFILSVTIFTFGILAFLPAIVTAQGNPKINVAKQCIVNTHLETSVEEPVVGVTWKVYDNESGELLAKTTTKDPWLSFDETDDFRIFIELWAIYEDYQVRSDTLTLSVSNGPMVDFEQWDDLVCSSADSTIYKVGYNQDFTYDWDLSAIEGYYIDVEGEYTNRIKISWADFIDITTQPKQFNISCTVSSGENVGRCETTMSRPVILLQNSVPTDESLKLIQKANDDQLLFCITEEPDLYRYDWGYVKSNDETVIESPNSSENYFRYENFDSNENNYFVDVLNKDFSYCKKRIWYNAQVKNSVIPNQNSFAYIEVINLFPNPAKQKLNIELLRKYDEAKELNVSILNNIGTLQNTYTINLDQEVVQFFIPVQALQNGHYIIQFEVDGFHPVIEKFVVIN